MSNKLQIHQSIKIVHAALITHLDSFEKITAAFEYNLWKDKAGIYHFFLRLREFGYDGFNEESNLGSIRLRPLGVKLTEIAMEDSIWLHRGPNLIRPEWDLDGEYFNEEELRASFARIRSVHQEVREYIIQALQEDRLIKAEETMAELVRSKRSARTSVPTRVFISYAHEDIQSAFKVYEQLNAIEGISPWFDKESLLPGMKWRPAIKKAIRESDFFLALLSKSSTIKRGYVQTEMKEALEIWDQFPEDKAYLIPIRLDECEPSYEKLREVVQKMKTQIIGKSIPRKEGRKKVTGQALYVDDLSFPGMLHGVTVRSSVPRGSIKNISFDQPPASTTAGGSVRNIPWNEFTIVTAKDIRDLKLGENCVALILDDQPYLADEVTNHPEEAIVLLAHHDKYLLEEARRHVRIEYEELPAVFSLQDSLAQKEIIWGEDNVFKKFLVDKGNVDDAWPKADFIVTGEYETGAQEQLYIENNGAIALANPNDGVTVWGSMQCPYYVHKALIKLFGLPEEKIRVIQTETGGGFGGKEEYPSMIAGHAALLAWKSGKPVKMIYDRAEDMAATTKRHPSRTIHKIAVNKDGKLLAMEIDFVIDGGAYCTLSPVVLSRGTIHAAGPYFCPNIRIKSTAVATNLPPHGAFRGFGAPQSIFALERHLDKVAKTVGLTPEEFRRRNFIHEGQTTATNQVIREKVDMDGLLDRAFKLSDYHAKRERFAKENAERGSSPTVREGVSTPSTTPSLTVGLPPRTATSALPASRIKKGIGFASFMHGAGFTGSGEVYLQSVVGAEATPEGLIRILAASTEIGQGTNTIFAQIAADALGLSYDLFEVAQPDTAQVPNSGPTVASRTCMIVGKLVESAVLGLKQTLIGCGLLNDQFTQAEFQKACSDYIEKFGPLKTFSKYQPPPNIFWDDEKYQGDAYGAFAWAVYVAEVSYDPLTYEAHVDDFVAVQEVGRVINPVLAAGQIEGGVAQAIGMTLYEHVIWENGRMTNGQMTNYIMPTAADVPPIRVYFEENPYAYGPAGAKGIGELPMDGPAPAILNAIENATGQSFNQIPLLPEMMMEGLVT